MPEAVGQLRSPQLEISKAHFQGCPYCLLLNFWKILFQSYEIHNFDKIPLQHPFKLTSLVRKKKCGARFLKLTEILETTVNLLLLHESIMISNTTITIYFTSNIFHVNSKENCLDFKQNGGDTEI